MDEILILMHRDVHFSGSFSAMLDYYQKGGVGAIDEIDLEDILHLKTLEEQNVPLTLGQTEKQMVAEARAAYKKMEALYDNPETALMADLVLEEEEKLDAFTEKQLPWLIELVHDSRFADPLYPGYGLAPVRAAKVLGRFKSDEQVARALFERLLRIADEEIYLQEEILTALRGARDFLLARLRARPLSYENQTAAMALATETVDPELSKIAREEHDRLIQEGCRDKQLLDYLEILYQL